MIDGNPRPKLLAELAALNANLVALGSQPVFSIEAARALDNGDLANAVKITGDRLVKVSKMLGE